MKLLLTSGGVTNASIHRALEELLGRPTSEASALCIPTAQYAHPMVGPGTKPWNFVTGRSDDMVGVGWGSVGLLELTALPSIDRALWEPRVRETDVLLAAGGDAAYLTHWMRESGLADLLPELADTVWVGMSAGSMTMTPRTGRDFLEWVPPGGPEDDRGLGVVDFAICPHLETERRPGNAMRFAERWSGEVGVPSYAVDDETAIRVVDGEVDVVSEGTWRYFEGQLER